MSEERITKLERIGKLLDEGKISQEEYERLKTEAMEAPPAPTPAPTPVVPPEVVIVHQKGDLPEFVKFILGLLIVVIVVFLLEAIFNIF